MARARSALRENESAYDRESVPVCRIGGGIASGGNVTGDIGLVGLLNPLRLSHDRANREVPGALLKASRCCDATKRNQKVSRVPEEDGEEEDTEEGSKRENVEESAEGEDEDGEEDSYTDASGRGRTAGEDEEKIACYALTEEHKESSEQVQHWHPTTWRDVAGAGTCLYMDLKQLLGTSERTSWGTRKGQRKGKKRDKI
ncbi:hypothetical protein NDU88_004593 [Pleurodeles waltl]|uniref:Uncharacterized protein n=1 Tax=Pleurodeles waltl TaxID=8319 RepID=A0AAV7M7J0_PLEWA|nr:hypothetical protein NDU88_004593 [Pleurodeles waltl]